MNISREERVRRVRDCMAKGGPVRESSGKFHETHCSTCGYGFDFHDENVLRYHEGAPAKTPVIP